MKAMETSRKHERLPEGHDIPGSGESPSKAIRRDERLARLQRAVDDLPAEYGRVIRLARIEGLRIKEIAERTMTAG
jgi:DNA-directed RNA polymerase specialized sigma24 family protein